ncbi:MAG TPA: AarF/UbiB family protein [Candidatus Limnocylindrales bacterium]
MHRRRFVLRVLVDTLLVAVLLWFLSLFTVNNPFPFGTAQVPIVVITSESFVALLVTGFLVALFESAVKPVVVALTGRLLLWSAGFFIVIVNAFVLWLVGRFAPLQLQVADPYFLWLLLVAVLYTILASLMDATLGLSRPNLEAAERGQSIWRVLDALPTPRRNAILENLRLQQVYDTVYRFGLDAALEGTPLERIRTWVRIRLLRERDELAGLSTPARVRIMLQQLGPMYVKIGQMIASRGAALPPEWLEELQKLQSDAAPFPWEQARHVIISQLGSPPEELFAEFEEQPFAAASTAQVHRARLLDGTLVAVKIQRPQIVVKTKADLGVMQELAKVAERRFDIAQRLGAEGIVSEFAAGVIKELDYRNETYASRRIAEAMTRFPDIHVPVVYGQLSGERVVTAEFVQGIKISKVDELRAAGFDTSALGATFVRALIKQVLVDGFFHGDPHPGNILVDPDTRRIVFLDFGLVGQLNQQQRIDLLDLINGLRTIDSATVANAVIALSHKSRSFDEVVFREDLDRVLRQYLRYGDGDASLAAGVGAVQSAVYNNGLQLDNQLTLALKAVIQAEETATLLSPTIDIGAAALEEARAALFEQVTPARMRASLERSALRIGREVVRRVPDLETAALSWFDQFNRGKFVVEIDTRDLVKQVALLNVLGRRLTVAMIIIGQLLATALFAFILVQPQVAAAAGFLPSLAIVFFFVVLGLSFVVLRRVWDDGDEDDVP